LADENATHDNKEETSGQDINDDDNRDIGLPVESAAVEPQLMTADAVDLKQGIKDETSGQDINDDDDDDRDIGLPVESAAVEPQLMTADAVHLKYVGTKYTLPAALMLMETDTGKPDASGAVLDSSTGNVCGMLGSSAAAILDVIPWSAIYENDALTELIRANRGFHYVDSRWASAFVGEGEDSGSADQSGDWGQPEKNHNTQGIRPCAYHAEGCCKIDHKGHCSDDESI
jgi:hypothetical protein